MTEPTLRLPVLALIAIAAWGQGANAPYKVHDTKPVITHGPILLNPSETGVSILWTTDTPCHSKVLYGSGQLDQSAEPAEHGMLKVDRKSTRLNSSH